MDGDSYSYDDEHFWYDTDKGVGHDQPSRRKKKRKVSQSRPQQHRPSLDLAVTGASCRLYRDDFLAERLEHGCHLINYFEDPSVIGDPSSDDEYEHEPNGKIESNHSNIRQKGGPRILLMDRYDARTLIDDYRHVQLKCCKGIQSNLQDLLDHINAADRESGLTANQIGVLNFERFGALLEYRTIFLSAKSKAVESSSNSAGIESGSVQKEDALELSQEEARCLPKEMMRPLTKRQNDIILLTAKRASEGAQFEVVLKVKQSLNPDFGFLDAKHELHPYYIWLKERGGSIVCKEKKTSSLDGDNQSSKPLSGLLAMYSSSSSDNESDGGSTDGDPNSDNNATKFRKTTTELEEESRGEDTATSLIEPDSANNSGFEQEETLKDLRAKRLQKAQRLKSHFNSKLESR